MPQTHKIVRDAIVALMSDFATGFNAQLALALPFYGVQDPEGMIALDWASPSTSVLYARIGGDFKVSKLSGRLTLQIAPNGSVFTNATRGIKWSGDVGARLVFVLRYSYRDGDDEPIEDETATAIATAIEDACIEVFNRRPIDWGLFRGDADNCDLAYAGRIDCPEGYITELFEDGVQVTVPMALQFKVDAQY